MKMKIIIILFGFMVAKDTWYQNAVWYQIFPIDFIMETIQMIPQ